MSETLHAQVDMLKRDVSELRHVDERHERSIDRLTGVTDLLQNQQKHLFEQQMEHGKLLLEHGRLHVQHSDAIAGVREQARQGIQLAADLAKEWRDAAQAIDRHVSGVAKSHSNDMAKQGEKIDALVSAVQVMNEERARERQEHALQTLKERDERALQTAALNRIASLAQSPRFVAYFTAGSFLGGMLVALAQWIYAVLGH